MAQFLFGFFRTLIIITAVLIGIGSFRLYAAPTDQTPAPRAYNLNSFENLPLIPASLSSQQAPIIPVLLLADPGRAYVLSAPEQQLQISIESVNGTCFDELKTTDGSGMLELFIANTRRCVEPRLVVFH